MNDLELRPSTDRLAPPLGPDQVAQLQALQQFVRQKQSGGLNAHAGRFVAFADSGFLLAGDRPESLLDEAAASSGLPPSRIVVEFVG